MLNAPSNMWVGASGNIAVGPIAVAWVGTTEAETLSSCQAAGCTLWDRGACKARGFLPCYFWGQFRTRQGKRSMNAAHAEGRRDYSFEHAMDQRLAIAKYVRLGMGGDHASNVDETVDQASRVRMDYGMGVLGYTHAWRQDHAKPLAPFCMASCDSLADADEAQRMGWRPAAILPQEFGIMPAGKRMGWPGPRILETPAGAKVVVCTKQVNPSVQCNTCGRCDPNKPGPIVGFIQHR